MVLTVMTLNILVKRCADAHDVADKPMTPPLLSIRDLRTYFYMKAGVRSRRGGVSFDIGAGETVASSENPAVENSVTALSI